MERDRGARVALDHSCGAFRSARRRHADDLPTHYKRENPPSQKGVEAPVRGAARLLALRRASPHVDRHTRCYFVGATTTRDAVLHRAIARQAGARRPRENAKMRNKVWRFGLLLALAASAVLAQARITGFLTGKITGPDGIPLPGVTVKATSPALQGERSATTATSGEFILRDLPAGVYEVELSLEGMATEKATVTVEIGRQDRLEVAMKP